MPNPRVLMHFCFIVLEQTGWFFIVCGCKNACTIRDREDQIKVWFWIPTSWCRISSVNSSKGFRMTHDLTDLHPSGAAQDHTRRPRIC